MGGLWVKSRSWQLTRGIAGVYRSSVLETGFSRITVDGMVQVDTVNSPRSTSKSGTALTLIDA